MPPFGRLFVSLSPEGEGTVGGAPGCLSPRHPEGRGSSEGRPGRSRDYKGHGSDEGVGDESRFSERSLPVPRLKLRRGFSCDFVLLT